MDTLVKAPRVKSNLSRRVATYVSKTPQVLDDAQLTKLIDDGLNSESLSFDDLMNVLSQMSGTRVPKKLRILGDEDFILLIEEIQTGKPLSATRNEVLMAIASGRIDPEIVDDLEDAICLNMMEESLDDESMPFDELMKVLRK